MIFNIEYILKYEIRSGGGRQCLDKLFSINWRFSDYYFVITVTT